MPGSAQGQAGCGFWVSWAQAGGWDEMIFKGSSTPKQPVGLFTSPFGSLAEAPSVSQPRAGGFGHRQHPPATPGSLQETPRGGGHRVGAIGCHPGQGFSTRPDPGPNKKSVPKHSRDGQPSSLALSLFSQVNTRRGGHPNTMTKGPFARAHTPDRLHIATQTENKWETRRGTHTASVSREGGTGPAWQMRLPRGRANP